MIGRPRPKSWFGLVILAVLSLGIVYFVGISASGKDIDETCAAAHQPLDDAYRAQNWAEPSRLFPLHDKCNANYDMIPAWINPMLVILAAAILVCLIGFIISVMTRLTRKAT